MCLQATVKYGGSYLQACSFISARIIGVPTASSYLYIMLYDQEGVVNNEPNVTDFSKEDWESWK